MSLDVQAVNLTIVLSEEYKAMRLDQALAKCYPDYSRTRLTEWIKKGQVWVDGANLEPKHKLQGGESIQISAQLVPAQEDLPQAIPLNIVYEDESLLIINKPAGLVVHPAAGNQQGTLLNALLYYNAQLALLPRAGIVHRLDKDTTGLMVIAKTVAAHTALVAALQRREIHREYDALVGAELIAGGTVEASMGRHPQNRLKMAVLSTGGKAACTHYRCKERYRGFTWLRVKLETGRTHQIRVHLSHLGFPIVGDALYGWRCKLPPKSLPQLQERLVQFRRQALHACRLSLDHPLTQERMAWEAAMPEDLAQLVELLQPRE